MASNRKKRHASEIEDDSDQESLHRSPKVRFDAKVQSVRYADAVETGPNSLECEEVDVLEEDLDVKILAINCNMLKVAAAYCETPGRTLSILEDTQDSLTFDLISSLLDQLRPAVIMVNAQAHNNLLDDLMSYCDEHDDTTVQICTSRDFAYSQAISRLTAIQLPSTSPDGSATKSWNSFDDVLDDEEVSEVYQDEEVSADMLPEGELDCNEMVDRHILSRLRCFISLDAVLAVGAAGALLSQVERVNAEHDYHGHIAFSKVEPLSSQSHMQINADALSSLSIMSPIEQQTTKTKPEPDGLSLFCPVARLNTCTTAQGTQMLQRWFLRPLASLTEISARHQSVDVLSRPENRQSSDLFRQSLKRMKNVQHIYDRLNLGDPREWACWNHFVDFLVGSVRIVDTIPSIRGWESSAVCRKIRTVCRRDELYALTSYLTEIIDLDTSQGEKRVTLHAGINERVDEANDLLAGLGATLDRVATIAKDDVPPEFRQGLTVVMFPQLGFLTEINMEDCDLHRVPLEFQFSNETSCFFKSPKMKELDEYMGDLYNEINDQTIEVLGSMIQCLSPKIDLILEASNLFAELDCILAFASATVNHQLVRPVMQEQSAMSICEGRHILHEMVAENYVKNDFVLGTMKGKEHHPASLLPKEDEEEQAANLMVITGANGSGKSALAKQIALIAYMAQIGWRVYFMRLSVSVPRAQFQLRSLSFVPAASACLGLVDKIFTRLQTKESALKPGSAFMIDVSQVSLALRRATSRSLLIIDEFGKGTNHPDGAGLLAGCIQSLVERGKKCPLTVIVTHFHEILEEIDRGVVKMHMQSQYRRDTGGCGEVVFSFKLGPYESGSSNAAECAARYGIPPEIVRRARAVTDLMIQYDFEKVMNIALSSEEIHDQKAAEDIVKNFLHWKPLEEISEGETDAKAKLEAMLAVEI